MAMGLHGIHDFRLPSMTPARAARGPSPDFVSPSGGRLALAPADLAAIYDLAPLYSRNITGAGQSLAVVGESDFNDADVLAFRQAFGLDPTLLPQRTLVPYSGSPGFPRGAFTEAELDLEWSGAVARNASVQYVFTGDNPTYGVWDAILYAIEEATSPIISASYSGCELGVTPNEVVFLETMGDAASMEGITVVNASGDWGASGCDYDVSAQPLAAQQGRVAPWPATIPSFVAVGGTELAWGDPIPEGPITPWIAGATPFATYWACSQAATQCSPTGSIPEVGWNEIEWEIANDWLFWGASGGGESAIFPKPVWQIGQTLPGQFRQVPDVALTAAYAQVPYVVSMSWTPANGAEYPPYAEALGLTGGTSAAAPSFAGILALVNQAVAANGSATPAGLGNANPVLYALSASTKGSGSPAFRDVTAGSNVVPCKPGSPDCPQQPPYEYGYQTGPGYDMVTGLGSVDGNNLVNAWAGLAPTVTTLRASAVTTAEANPVSFEATVASNATAYPMTGSVLFYFETTDDAGVGDLSRMVAAPLTPAAGGGAQSGTARATARVPPGVLGQARVVAFYGGDARYLASWSAPAVVAATSTLAALPVAITLQPNEPYVFATAGGAPPLQWALVRDSTCDATYRCAQVEALTATTGAFQAGPRAGSTVIAAIDADGAEARVTVTVAGPPVDGGALPPAWDGGGWDAGAIDSGSIEDAQAAEGAPTDALPDQSVYAAEAAIPSGDGSVPTDAGSPETSTPADGAPGVADGGPDVLAMPDASLAGEATDPAPDAAALVDTGLPLAGPRADSNRGGGASTGCGCTAAGREPASASGALAVLFVLGAASAASRRRLGLRCPQALPGAANGHALAARGHLRTQVHEQGMGAARRRR